jgi:hypothetical protein
MFLAKPTAEEFESPSYYFCCFVLHQPPETLEASAL